MRFEVDVELGSVMIKGIKGHENGTKWSYNYGGDLGKS